jgi:hypothetical protein
VFCLQPEAKTDSQSICNEHHLNVSQINTKNTFLSNLLFFFGRRNNLLKSTRILEFQNKETFNVITVIIYHLYLGCKLSMSVKCFYRVYLQFGPSVSTISTKCIYNLDRVYLQFRPSVSTIWTECIYNLDKTNKFGLFLSSIFDRT